ncbi:hypothetical protein [Flavobacterium seoulense]|uniref:hypothetical protein n=1 Tax=Flavobacterium seoulense TaxID=1492738 RepID=UPI001F377A70|nr:hypothetical protein [Flavobacterium seoulense]
MHKGVLGRYERNEVFPSIDIARKIADSRCILDNLTGKEEHRLIKTPVHIF